MHWKALVAGLACALALPLAPAHAANAELNAEVAAGQTSALRLRELPAKASIGLRIESSGPIRVIFVHENGLKRSGERPRPLFTGVTQRRLSFRLSIPLAGTYYVILDNRKGAEAREVRVLIDATRKARPPQKRQPAPDLNAT